MSFLFRSVAAARALPVPRLAASALPRIAPTPAASPVARLLPLSLRFSSSTPSSSSTSAPQPSPSVVFNTDAPSSRATESQPDSRRGTALDIPLPDASHLVPDLPNADAWWRASNLTAGRGFPGTRFSGRSLPSRSGNDYAKAYSMLNYRLTAAKVRKEWKQAEYHETPSKRRVRLQSERHRRRFKEMIRERVQQVQLLRARK
ncbi:hypothetical protein VHUM_02668 [Vanrija humicola]|uniref:Ribosomal protein S21 n=1 Tax=Vanrija humicola TaxID=5417 RepID=A0A7D8UZ28_VANHU|nr:hypothetical protein VHUM_02668 [Vanrija humicola]